MTTTPRSRSAGFAAGPDGLLPTSELDLLHRLRKLAAQYRDGRDSMKVLQAFMRLGMEFFGAREGCVAVTTPAGDDVEILYAQPKGAEWDRDDLLKFANGKKVPSSDNRMFARVRRHDRLWGVLGVRDGKGRYGWASRRALSTIAATATETMNRIDQDRIREVRDRIDRKIMRQVRPKDLFYQILHGLRSLTDYDHSSALLLLDDAGETLEIVAEQVAWRKGKGTRVGAQRPIAAELVARLREGFVRGFDRDGVQWRPWTPNAVPALAELLDYAPEANGVRESSMLCAPLVLGQEVQGVLKIASIHPHSLRSYEASLVERFLPQVSVAIQNAQRTESLEAQVLIAERKHAMADLARGVSHDVNNALGVVIPLVQELREEMRQGEIDPTVVAGDLDEIDRSLGVCRRIFTGMLDFARGQIYEASEVRLATVVETTMAILREGLYRNGVHVEIDVPLSLPLVRGVQADLEQLLLNLVTNARDAMPEGGTLAIRGETGEAGLELIVRDTGAGIAPGDLARILEPFFSTKDHGHGLGLAICRSIVAQLGGRIIFKSDPGDGTRVTVHLPAVEEDEP